MANSLAFCLRNCCRSRRSPGPPSYQSKSEDALMPLGTLPPFWVSSEIRWGGISLLFSVLTFKELAVIFSGHPTVSLRPSFCFNLPSNSANWQDLGSFSSPVLSGVKVLSNFLFVDTVPAGTLPWEFHCHSGLMKGPFQLAHFLSLIVHIHSLTFIGIIPPPCCHRHAGACTCVQIPGLISIRDTWSKGQCCLNGEPPSPSNSWGVHCAHVISRSIRRIGILCRAGWEEGVGS